MEKKFKNVAWFSLVSLAFVLLAALFGMLATNSLVKNYPEFEGGKTILTIVIIVASVVLIITNVISFISIRNGEVKSTILSVAKQSRVQNIGPIMALILALLGIFLSAALDKTDPNRNQLIFVIASFAIATFATGYNSRGLKAYRKDKETFSYIYVSAFITAGALVFFGIVSAICMTKIPKLEGTHVVGFTIACSLFYILADIMSYLCLGIVALLAQKYAPKVTMADADAQKLDDLNKNVEKLVNRDAVQSNNDIDNIAKLREYKKLLDDGIISQEEFEEKKKELL